MRLARNTREASVVACDPSKLYEDYNKSSDEEYLIIGSTYVIEDGFTSLGWRFVNNEWIFDSFAACEE